MTNTSTTEVIDFPIDQAEQAHLKSRKNFLAQDVFKKIALLLRDSLAKLPTSGCVELDELRKHEAILVHGGRGTGKSSVLVNLRTYMNEEPELRDNLLILKPVDPTLLENGEDLLLNIIVAALMRDAKVKEALQNNESMAEVFYDQLHRLGAALEGIQKQKDQFGLDKLRAFIGNQDLAEHVHRLFKCTLDLTGKRLIVMPIDDVDTSLQHAFENIEVVRKYLTSPYVVPIISGDLDLYDDVIRREFLGRLVEKVPSNDGKERERARDLAAEYQRKVLPLPRRIPLPELSSYLNNDNINLVDKKNTLFPLPMLRHWIEALLNERVNGEENSYQRLPLQTVREMAQLIQTTQDVLPRLGEFLDLKNLDQSSMAASTMIRRYMFMPKAVANALHEFSTRYTHAYSSTPDEGRKNRTSREHAYRDFREATTAISGAMPESHAEFLRDWYRAMCSYFFYQHNGAPAFLTSNTNLIWSESKRTPEQSVLAVDMFQPQNYRVEKYPHFSATSEVRKPWSKALDGKVPGIWLDRLPEKTVLAYPIPERGQPISVSRSNEKQIDICVENEDMRLEAEFMRRLMVHWSFYSPNQRSNLVLTGRLFELVVTSLVRDLTVEDVFRIIDRPPFYSVAAMASTKTLTLSGEEIPDEPEDIAAGKVDEASMHELVVTFVRDVNAWRQQHRLLPPHSWLIYNVMNKYFNQAGFFNNPDQKRPAAHLRDAMAIALQAFNSMWSAVGSFEKGDIFGLPRVIANVNMSGADKNFHKSVLYTQNIRPFLQEKDETEFFDFKTGSLTFALDSHPLRILATKALAAVLIPLDQVLTKTQLSGLSSPSPSWEQLRKLDAIVNKALKNTRFERLSQLSRREVMAMIESIRAECRKKELLAAYDYVERATDLPAASGRKKLQRCIQRLEQLEKNAEPAETN